MASISQYVFGLFVCLLLVSCIHAQETNTTEAVEPEVKPELELIHKESTTSSIELEWIVADPSLVENFVVQSKKINSESITKSGLIEEYSYVVEDLRTNTNYEICVLVNYKDAASEDGVECVIFSTVPLIRFSSWIALLGVLGYVLLMVLLAYICWRHKMNQLQAEEDEEALDPDGVNEKMNTNQEPITYLSAPPRPGQKSSIEDPDIPYITPPVEQLTQTERDKFFGINPSKH